MQPRGIDTHRGLTNLRILILAAALILLSATATHASRVEDLTGLHYQHDAGREGDAPDRCHEGAPWLKLNENYRATVVPGDDERDHFVLFVDDVAASGPLTLVWEGSPVMEAGEVAPRSPLALRASVYGADCAAPLAVGSSTHAGYETLTFVPPAPGVYVLQFAIRASEGTGGLPGPTADECHLTCDGAGASTSYRFGVLT